MKIAMYMQYTLYGTLYSCKGHAQTVRNMFTVQHTMNSEVFDGAVGLIVTCTVNGAVCECTDSIR